MKKDHDADEPHDGAEKEIKDDKENKKSSDRGDMSWLRDSSDNFLQSKIWVTG